MKSLYVLAKRVKHVITVNIGHNSVDRLKLKCVVVYIYHLDKSVPCGMECGGILTDSFLDLFVGSLCGSQGMISVTHGEHKRRELSQTVFILNALGGDKRVKSA